MNIGEKIRKFRLLRNYTQAQLGSKVKLSGDRIRQYESNVRSPKTDKLQEIAGALNVNINALDNPNLDNPLSIMHSFFELEEKYGLHVEKNENEFHLVFSSAKSSSSKDLLIEFLDGWFYERIKYQPTLDDTPEDIEDKKLQYEDWKARFPYSMYDRINKQFDIVLSFMEDLDKQLNSKTAITTFSEFFQHLLTVSFSGLSIVAKKEFYTSELCSTFTIKCSNILELKNESKSHFAQFRRDLIDLKKMGYNVLETPRQINNETYVKYVINSPQIAAICDGYNNLIEMKNSSTYDEEYYNYEVDNNMRIFDVPISDYISPRN